MSDGNASPAKADSGTTTPAPAVKDLPKFSEKEEMVLKVAWQCLKSGPPEIDMEKLTKLGGFNTTKTCQNTWGVIKKKLMSMAPAAANGEGEDGATTPKPKATPKKRTKKADSVDGEDAAATNGSPAKKARTPKKADAAANGEDTGSPVKKARTPKKGKAKVEVKAEEDAEMGDAEVKEE